MKSLLKSKSLLSRSGLHTCSRLASTQVQPSSQGRWGYTAEIMVSKLFPAGFGWQAASCVADSSFGLAATSAGFAVMTGLGDMTGVFTGHMVYKAIQGSASSMDIDLSSEAKTATWLATAAFFTGTSWQPIVNFLHDTCELGFTPTFLGVTAGCGGVFMGGLALGRVIYPWMPSHDSKSLMQDAGLCLSIGGATAMFVATDPSFVGAQADALYSALAPVFNIGDDMSVLAGCATAGASTFTGFALFNGAQSAILPAGSNWMDNNNPYAPAEEVEEEATA